MTTTTNVALGDKVRDTITGFEGVVTGICDYITGCNQALVQPRVKEDGSRISGEWFDTDRLERLDAPRVVIAVKNAGADTPAPIR